MPTFFERLSSLKPARGPFPIVRVGYTPSEVDAFLLKARSGDVSDVELLNTSFSTTKNGYDRAAVHRYLAGFVGNPTLLDFKKIEPLAA